MSPALAGRFSTTAPPGKPKNIVLFKMQKLQEEFNHLGNREYFDCFLSFFFPKQLAGTLLHLEEKDGSMQRQDQGGSKICLA